MTNVEATHLHVDTWYRLIENHTLFTMEQCVLYSKAEGPFKESSRHKRQSIFRKHGMGYIVPSSDRLDKKSALHRSDRCGVIKEERGDEGNDHVDGEESAEDEIKLEEG